jgi:hypothetical protein
VAASSVQAGRGRETHPGRPARRSRGPHSPGHQQGKTRRPCDPRPDARAAGVGGTGMGPRTIQAALGRATRGAMSNPRRRAACSPRGSRAVLRPRGSPFRQSRKHTGGRRTGRPRAPGGRAQLQGRSGAGLRLARRVNDDSPRSMASVSVGASPGHFMTAFRYDCPERTYPSQSPIPAQPLLAYVLSALDGMYDGLLPD